MNDLPPIPSFDLTVWAADTAILAAAVVFLTAVIRKWFWRTLDGEAVPLFSTALSVAIAVGLHFLGHLDTLTAAITHGCAAGVLAFGGVDAVRGVLQTGKQAPLALVDGQDTAAAFILNLAKGLVPKNKVTKAIEELAPLLRQYAGALLTPEMRAELQKQVHTTLKKARLVPERDFQ